MNKNLLSQTPKSPMAKAARLIELQNIMKSIKPEIDAIKADLLKVTQELDVYTLKTGSYTISRAKKVTPEVVNFETLKKSLDEKNIPYQTVKAFSVNMRHVFQKLIEDKVEIEGLDGLETEYIMVRINK